MFTGIVEAVSTLISVKRGAGKNHYTITRPKNFDDLIISSSIAVNGICLTVIAFDTASFTVEVMNETLQKTTAANWKIGEKLNLERAIKIGGRLDGHWVQGHIDKTAALLQSRTIRETLYLSFALAAEDKALVVPQGSISINGVSLTISELLTNRFTVALIGHTLENTNLKKVPIGQPVNLEFDILGKYLLRQRGSKTEQTGLIYDL
jgi:riboflavin synthase